MTKAQVLKTRWGEPDTINTTTTSRVTTVQWVYGGIDESPHGPLSMDLIVGAQRV